MTMFISNDLISLLLAVVMVITILFTVNFFETHRYWKKRGVPSLRPVPFFGNTFDITCHRLPPALVFQRIYNQLRGFKFGGFYTLTKPTLLVNDPELVHNVMNRYFNHFQDRSSFLEDEKDSLSSHLLNLTGNRWKTARKKVLSAFSPGNVRGMEGKVKACLKHLDEHLKNENEAGLGGVTNVWELMAKLSTDVIGSCAFGLQCDSIRNKNSEFRRIGSLVCESSSTRSIIRDIFRHTFPRFNRLFNLSGHLPEVDNFFMKLVRALTESRATGNAEEDLLQILINLSKSDPSFTEHSVAANIFFIFIAGYSTISSTLSYMLYEMAQEPEIWNRLRQEVQSNCGDNGENLVDYNTLKKLPFMDAVVSETLRKYPVFPTIQRKCTESFRIPGEEGVVIEKGIDVIVSVHGLHYDENYWPNPDMFLPERFKERETIRAGTYIPFGAGPRGCIGYNYAMFIIKATICHLVDKFEIKNCGTPKRLEFVPRGVILAPKGGIWLQIQRRPDHQGPISQSRF